MSVWTILEFVADKAYMLTHDPLMRLARDGGLSFYLHQRFRRSVDTNREHQEVNRLRGGGAAPCCV